MLSPVRDRVLYYVNLYTFRISFGKVRIPHLFTELLGGKKNRSAGRRILSYRRRQWCQNGEIVALSAPTSSNRNGKQNSAPTHYLSKRRRGWRLRRWRQLRESGDLFALATPSSYFSFTIDLLLIRCGYGALWEELLFFSMFMLCVLVVFRRNSFVCGCCCCFRVLKKIALLHLFLPCRSGFRKKSASLLLLRFKVF